MNHYFNIKTAEFIIPLKVERMPVSRFWVMGNGNYYLLLPIAILAAGRAGSFKALRY
jgi:hypothetical protein